MKRFSKRILIKYEPGMIRSNGKTQLTKQYIEKAMAAPKCRECNKRMSPAGGYVFGHTTIWRCWDCDTETNDVHFKEVK